MRGSLPPLIMNLFLQRQPMAVHYLKQSVMEYTYKQMPIHHHRFSLKTHGTMTAEDRTSCPLSGSNKDEDPSIEPLDFGRSILQSFVFVSTLTNQYEEPLGISEFVGYSSKQRSWTRHRCCGRMVEGYTSEVGQKESVLISSEVCDECSTIRDHRNGFNTGRTRHTCT